MTGQATLGFEAAEALALRACLAVGADERTASVLVSATLSAHRHGRHSVGLPHLVDYLGALKAGRINGRAEPRLSRPFAAFLESDADGGIAQLGFEQAFSAIIETAFSFGICLFTQRHSFTTGELGHYARRLGERGLVALAFTNANALLAPAPGSPATYSTNPLAFAFPLGADRPPIVIDQSSSATAFVNIMAAARRGEPLAEGIAVDAAGQPTINAAEALKGALLPFGGQKGANMALLVEMMAAGVSGGSWSSAAPSFQTADAPLDTGLTVICLVPGAAQDQVMARASDHAAWLKAAGIHVPGVTGKAEPADRIVVDRAVLDAIEAFAAG